MPVCCVNVPLSGLARAAGITNAQADAAMRHLKAAGALCDSTTWGYQNDAPAVIAGTLGEDLIPADAETVAALEEAGVRDGDRIDLPAAEGPGNTDEAA